MLISDIIRKGVLGKGANKIGRWLILILTFRYGQSTIS